MKKSTFIVVLTITLISLASTAFAGAETRCVAYGNANALSYCIKYMTRGGTVIRTQGMNPHNAQLFSILASQPTVVPMSYGPYATTPASSTTLQAISALGMISANVMSAAAWAYDWRHGYVSARGVAGAAYMMNYPW